MPSDYQTRLSIIVPVLNEPLIVCFLLSNISIDKWFSEEFSTSIKRMEMISRITNGISLRQGLSKGSVNNEELISELLNLGDVKPTDIIRIDTEELKKLVESIQKLPDALSESKDTEDIEKQLEVLSSLVNIVSKEKKLEEPGKEYLAEVTKIKNSELDWSGFNYYAATSSDLFTAAKNVKNVNLSTIKQHYDAEILLDPLQNRINSITKKFDFKSFEQELKSEVISETKKKLGFFSTVVVTIKSIEQIQYYILYDKTDDPMIKSLENGIIALAAVIDKVWEDLETIHTLETLFVSRLHRRGNHNSKLIPGFLSGTSDLSEILNDLKDSWLQTKVHVQSGNIEKSLHLFRALKDKTEALENFIGTLSDPSSMEMSVIQTQVKFLSQFNQISGVSQGTLKNVLKSSADAKDLIPKNIRTFGNLYDNMNQLYDQFTSIKETFNLHTTFSKKETIDKLNRIKELTPTGDLKEALNNLKKLKESKDLKDVMTILKKAKKFIEIAKETFDMKQTATSISDNYDQMGIYVQQVNKFLEKVKPLKQNDNLSDLKSVFKDIETIREGINNNKFGAKINVDPVIKTIGKTKSALKELDDTINSMKQAKGSEIDELVGMTDATESARNIGSATKAISSMNKFLDMDTSKLESAVEMLQDSSIGNWTAEDEYTLKALASLVIQIPKFKQEIKSFKDSVQPITSSKLSDYSEIFEKAKSVGGITRDFLALSVSVGKLAKLIPEDESELIDEVKDLLVNMDKLCLTYSKYQTGFDESKNTLNNIDLLFTNQKRSKTGRPQTTVLPPTKNAGIVSEVADKMSCPQCQEKEECSTLSAGAIIVIIVASAFVVLIVVTIGLTAYINHLEKKRGKREP
ncbi:hypothetical protein CAEBREN_01120 [Caenorhabditis brenneri]|uniref:Domain of unknown function WSN domain-containing protein n=1 Tax=Caenorhabditis brenneri TaxID=135651 RepID=G0MJU9_CAEBE|nr:hypothetical protein CAEBREN_01120 [Caenorhabditis brenneri]